MDNKLLMETASRAGEIMLGNGAEIYRVEDTINRILETSHMEVTEAFVVATGIVATLDGKNEENITVVKRVKDRNTDLNKIARVNTISRNYCSGKITLEEANKRLKEIPDSQYSTWLKLTMLILVASGFTLIFGGNLWDAMGAGIVGVLLAVATGLGEKYGTMPFIQDLISSMIIAITAVIVKRNLFSMINVDLVIIGSIMPLVPGTAITNAIRDTLHGEYVAGGARILEAFVKAFSIALGVGVGLAIMGGGAK